MQVGKTGIQFAILAEKNCFSPLHLGSSYRNAYTNHPIGTHWSVLKYSKGSVDDSTAIRMKTKECL